MATVHTSTSPSLQEDGKEKMPASVKPVVKLDIEHAVVQDDPRKWSKHRKVCPHRLYARQRRVSSEPCQTSLYTLHLVFEA